MNVVFLSPNFPPNYEHFCGRLRALGATVLGISDQPYDSLTPALRDALAEYYYVSDLHHYDEVLRAVGYFTHRYGKIDRIDSLNEHWLETEARLRTDFNVDGFKLADLPSIKRKSEMKRLFARAKVAVARGAVVKSPAQARRFVAEVGYPVVAKPDIGVGANRTYKITNRQELDEFLDRSLVGYMLEEYVQGVIQTFDGLTDRSGEPVFYTSMQYSRGVMEVVNEDDDVYYYTQREIPPDLEHAGRNIIRAFGVRERFFHFEFFRTPDGRLIALEVNMRPPGGLSLDLFNYANDIDLYYEWANVVVNNRFDSTFDWPYHACYVGRKGSKAYAHSHEQVLERYGSRIIHHQPMAQVFHRAMGDYGYIVRSPDLEEVLEVARYIQQKS
ncbi:MAG: ATP-grasp domain-containing protein [Chloroflexota bacterium]|nr:MAG: carboxylate--amine ligase [Chloroflexota bacterium]